MEHSQQFHSDGCILPEVKLQQDSIMSRKGTEANISVRQETLNYWKQLPHILKYFRADEEPNARLPKNFMSGFLEVLLSFLQRFLD
jgi:hypothetical protein